MIGARLTQAQATFKKSSDITALRSQGAIGVFDSGVGGLSVAREIARVLPHESMIYVGDSARCPYGTQSLELVQEFTLQICSYLEQQSVKLIVIACNTATAAGLALARERCSVPVIGVVEPGARACVRATRSGRVGVIATQATVDSQAYTQAIHALDQKTAVYSQAAPGFVDLAERADLSKVLRDSESIELAHHYLDDVLNNDIDTLVLGCTHFPLLHDLISLVAGGKVRLISSAQETAREVNLILDTFKMKAASQDGEVTPRYKFMTTADPHEFAQKGSRVFGRALGDVEHLEVEALCALRDQQIR